MRCRRNDQARQIAQLEQKLNDLTSLIGPANRSRDAGESNVITPESTGPASSGSISTSTSIEPRYAVPQDLPTVQEYQGKALNPEHELEPTSFTSPARRNSKSPDDLLDIFLCDMAYQVPFVSVPSQISARALSRESPFLYRSIMTVASYHNSVHQLQLGQELVRYLIEHLIVLGEKNMDLLQGLLVYINW